MKLFLSAAALLTLCTGQSCTHDEVKLDVDFRKKGNSLIIENKNAFDYKELDAVVNDSYHYRVASLKANETLSIPLDSFATKEGSRFSPSKNKLESMSLHAITDDGPFGRMK